MLIKYLCSYLSMHLLMDCEREASAMTADWCWMMRMLSGVTAAATPRNRSSSILVLVVVWRADPD